MTNEFRVVFDIAMTPDRWWQEMGWMLILPLAGVLFIFVPDKVRNWSFYHGPKGRTATIFGICFALTTGAMLTFFTADHFYRKAELTALKRHSQLHFVEGCLQRFHPMPRSGHGDERITVEGRNFSYSDFDETSPAFNNTETYGGPLHRDSKVRIWYSGNDIVRMEVKNRACPPAPDYS